MSIRKQPTDRPSKYPLEFHRDAVAMVLDEHPQHRGRCPLARGERGPGELVAETRRERSAVRASTRMTGSSSTSRSTRAALGGRISSLSSQRQSDGLEIHHQIITRSGAADEEVPSSRSVDRLRRVLHLAGDEAGRAGVTDPSPAGPADRHATRLGELEDRAVAIVPACRQATAGKRHRRPGSGRFVGKARRTVGATNDTRSHRSQCSEALRVEVVGIDTEPTERGGEIRHEARRTAKVHVSVGREAEARDGIPSHMTQLDARLDESVIDRGRAVADLRARSGQLRQQFAGLGGEGVLRPVPSTMHPPHGTGRAVGDERVEHGEHRRHTDTGRHQRRTGSDPGARVKVPRGAAASIVCPGAAVAWMWRLATPPGSRLTLMR